MSGRHGRRGSDQLRRLFTTAAVAVVLVLFAGGAFAVWAAFAPKQSASTSDAGRPDSQTSSSTATQATPSRKPTPTPDSAPVVSAAATAPATSGPGQFVAVLMYHHIKPNPDNLIAISPAMFEQQMGYLRDNGYHPVTMSQFDAWATGAARLPDKPVLITFDDGRHNQLDYAVPILKKYGFTATFFVCKKWVTGGTKVFMNADEIRTLVADGYDVESHTNSHTFLVKSRSEQPDWMYKRLWGETNGMRVWLEKLTGKPVTALAYPGGAHDKYTAGLAKAAGYTTAFTTDSGLNYNGGQSQYLIRRYNAGAKGLRFATFVTIFTHTPKVK